MNIEREIMFERFKGLYEAFDELLGLNCNSFRLEQRLEASQKGASVLSSFTEELEKEVKSSMREKESILKDCKDFLSVKASFFSNRDKTEKLFREKYSNLQVELAKCIQEREGFRLKHLDLESKFLETSEELKKLRARMKQKFANNSELLEERYCGKCNKTYMEHSNFNWSCKTHQTAINDNIFWCCGKQGKDAPGCMISKHTNKEEESEKFENFIPVNFCSGCKQHGHSTFNCPKDPNMRTNADIEEEKERLLKVYIPKRKMSFNGIQLQSLEILNGRMVAESTLSEQEREEMEGTGFADLMILKEELELDEKEKWFSVKGIEKIVEVQRKKNKKKVSGVLYSHQEFEN